MSDTKPKVSRRRDRAHLNPKNRFATLDLGWLRVEQSLTRTELVVLLVINSHANDAGYWDMSRELIAQEAGFGDDVRRVSMALRKLEKLRKPKAVKVDRRSRDISRYWPQRAPDVEPSIGKFKPGQINQA
jgi:hypothetical protein